MDTRAGWDVVTDDELGACIGFDDQSGAAPTKWIGEVAGGFDGEGDIGGGGVFGNAEAQVMLIKSVLDP